MTDKIIGAVMERMPAAGFAGVMAVICNPLVGEFSQILQVMMIIVVLDLLAGLFAAIAMGVEVKLSKFATGLIKKMLYVILIVLAFQTDRLAGTANTFVVRDGVALAVCIYEGLSVLKNLRKAKVFVPEQLFEILKNLGKQ